MLKMPQMQRENILKRPIYLDDIIIFSSTVEEHLKRIYRHYLTGRKFLLRTDYGALKWIFSFKEPEGQVAWWLETLCSFDFDIIHRPGIQHSNGDALSRRPCPDDCNTCGRWEDKDTMKKSEEEQN